MPEENKMWGVGTTSETYQDESDMSGEPQDPFNLQDENGDPLSLDGRSDVEKLEEE